MSVGTVMVYWFRSCASIGDTPKELKVTSVLVPLSASEASHKGGGLVGSSGDSEAGVESPMETACVIDVLPATFSLILSSSNRAKWVIKTPSVHFIQYILRILSKCP
eukprot:XP_001706908.1 Hypothetical protein GL50803_19974 [Giardia lamblia ATCC 50803]